MIQNRHSILFLGDILALCLSFLVMALIRFNFPTQEHFILLQAKLFVGIFIIWLIIFFIFDLYNIKRINPNPQNIGLLVAAMAINTGLAILLFYLFPQAGISPKTNLAIIAISGILLLIVWRRLFYTLFTSTFKRTIGTLGESALMTKLRTELAKHPHLGNVTVLSEETLNTQAARIDLLVAEHISPTDLVAISTKLQSETLSLAKAYEILFAKIPVELMTDERAIAIIANQQNPASRFFYRLIESVLALAGLIITSPFLLMAIIAIVLEDGTPVFYSQTRTGKNGKPFSIYKLRSMKKNAETNGAQWADQKDNRITRVGGVLRKLHIDELPQMWNIVIGDLAFIGPRPERPEIVANLEKEIPYYFLRHTIRPGFTGWAQIKFRYARTVLDSQEKFEYDLYYLLNKNPLLDVGVFLKTVQIIFTH